MIHIELSRDKAEFILELLEKAGTDDPRSDMLVEWFKEWLGALEHPKSERYLQDAIQKCWNMNKMT